NMMGLPEHVDWRPSRFRPATSQPEDKTQETGPASEQPVEKIEVPLTEREELLLRVFENLKKTRTGPFRTQDLLNAAQSAGFRTWPVSEMAALLGKGRLFSTGKGMLDDIVSDDRAEVTTASQKELEELRRKIDALRDS